MWVVLVLHCGPSFQQGVLDSSRTSDFDMLVLDSSSP